MKTLESSLAAAAVALALAAPGTACAAVERLSEGFDDVGSLPGWTLLNRSSAPGSTWFQGNAGVFGSHAGAPDAYAAASFLGSSDPFGTVDNWLITPVLSLSGITNLSFRTRNENLPGFADTLEVRFIPGAAGVDVSTLLDSIGGAAYPADWTLWRGSLSVEGTGRFAFRYLGDADTLNYVGLDTVRVVTAVPEPSLLAMLALGLGAMSLVRRKP